MKTAHATHQFSSIPVTQERTNPVPSRKSAGWPGARLMRQLKSFSLAAYRYRQIFADQGGPVERIEFSEFPIMGRKCFQANAFLSEEIVGKRPEMAIYSNADGTGTHTTPIVARYMAISEALERWAFHVKVKDFDRDLYGFDVDSSSNGMAAFPGLFARQCRAKAYFEALERYGVISWWDGRLASRIRPTEWSDVQALEIDHDLGHGTVVIVFKRCSPGFYAFGHAAAEDFQSACRKAVIELCRNEYVLRCFRATHPGFRIDELNEVKDLFERRCLFFSFDDGFDLFCERAESEPEREPLRPEVLFDGEIMGPWSHYATVWRVAMTLPTTRYLDPLTDFFFW